MHACFGVPRLISAASYTSSCITLIHVNLLSPSARGTRQHNQHMRTCAERHRATYIYI